MIVAELMQDMADKELAKVAVDYDGLACGMLDMIDTMPDAESYKGALAFGMLPAPLMDMASRQTSEKLGEALGTENLSPDGRMAVDERLAVWLREFNDKLGKAMYKHASARGLMVV